MKNISRRTAIKTVLAGSAAMAVSGMEAAARPERLAYRAETWFDGCDGAGCGLRYRQGVQ